MIRGLLAVAAIATVGLTQTATPISIGLVREDGYLIPIAIVTPELFDQPIPQETLVNGEPLPPIQQDWPLTNLAWTLSYGRGRKPASISTFEEVTVRMPYCSDRLAWRTTLKLPPPPAYVAPISNIGLAVRGAVVDYPENVAHQPDAASRRVARLIVHLVHSKEAEVLAEMTGPLGVTSPGDPRQIPIRIPVLMRHVVSGVSTYYFEATKPLKASDGAVLDDAGLVTGWIVDSAAGLQHHHVEFKINDDSYKQNDRARIWGIVPYGAKTLWVLEWRGWESQYYTLHDWPSGVTRLIVDAYNC